MKKLIIFLLCVAVLGGGGTFAYKSYMKNKDEKIVVDVVSVSRMYEPGEYLSSGYSMNFGMVGDSNAQKVSMDTAKLVSKVCVEEGQEVKKGDTLFEYDMTVVELELAKKENSITLLEQDIKRVNKEIEAIKKYKPAESAPKEPQISYDNFFEMPEEPEMPDMPEMAPVYTVDEVTPSFSPADGNGSAARPFIINCKPSARIDKFFVMQMVNERKYVEICVYDGSSNYLYKWIIEPSMSLENIGDWRADTGVSIDASGAVTLDTGASMPAKLSFAAPRSEKFGGSSDGITTSDEDTIMPEPQPEPNFPTDYNEPTYDPNNFDYQYTRAEIQDLIVSKQNQIKAIELDIKKAKRELETYKKRQKTGKETADRDGIVRKIGKASNDTEEDERSDDEDYYGQPDPYESYFAVVEGSGGTEVIFEAHEFDLDKYAIGTQVNVNSFMNPASTVGVISEISKEPISYSSYDWGKNPNGSTYTVHARLEDPESFALYDTVSISLDGEDSAQASQYADSILIPMHYVRQDGADYYILRASEDGTLEKRYVTDGAVLDYGLMKMIEIKGGISLDDKICFPYGKGVKEGVKTRETNEVLYPESMKGLMG